MKKVAGFILIAVFLFIFGVARSQAESLTQDKKTVGDVKALVGAVNIPGDGTSTIIYIKPGRYVLHDTLRINRSNVTIIAEPGARLVLANKVNRPVLAIGSQEQTPSYTVNNIFISGVEIDGNKANQTSEYDAKRPWIRNNGIDVRAVTRLTIENVISENNISGGLVISYNSSDVHIGDSSFTNNYYDGVAYYSSEKIFTTNCSMLSNGHANSDGTTAGGGVSIDNGLGDSTFANCIIEGNIDVGIFGRNSSRIRFNNCAIEDNGSYAAFLSHDDQGNGVHDIMFSGCQILNNNGGIIVSSDTQSDYTSITRCTFRGNEQNGRKSIDTAGSTVWQAGNIMQ